MHILVRPIEVVTKSRKRKGLPAYTPYTTAGVEWEKLFRAIDLRIKETGVGPLRPFKYVVWVLFKRSVMFVCL